VRLLLDGSERLSSPSVSRNVSFMSAKSSTSSAPGDRCRDDGQPAVGPAATTALSRTKSVKRSSLAAGGAKTTQSQALMPRTATVITGGRGYVHNRCSGQGRLGDGDGINGGGTVAAHLDGTGCLVVWNQKLQ